MSDHLGIENGRSAGAPSSLLRDAVGLAVLGFGLIVAAWVIVSLIGMLDAEKPPGIIAAVMPADDKPVTLGMPEGQFTLPAQIFVPIAYLLACFIHAILATIAGMMISGGVSLLQPDMARILRRYMDRMDRK
jgi:hypothetical protein